MNTAIQVDFTIIGAGRTRIMKMGVLKIDALKLRGEGTYS